MKINSPFHCPREGCLGVPVISLIASSLLLPLFLPLCASSKELVLVLTKKDLKGSLGFFFSPSVLPPRLFRMV